MFLNPSLPVVLEVNPMVLKSRPSTAKIVRAKVDRLIASLKIALMKLSCELPLLHQVKADGEKKKSFLLIVKLVDTSLFFWSLMIHKPINWMN